MNGGGGWGAAASQIFGQGEKFRLSQFLRKFSFFYSIF